MGRRGDASWKDPIRLCVIRCVWGRVGKTVGDEKEVRKWVVEMWGDEFPVDVEDDRNGEELSRRGYEQIMLREKSESKLKTSSTGVPGMSIHLDEVTSPQNPFEV